MAEFYRHDPGQSSIPEFELMNMIKGYISDLDPTMLAPLIPLALGGIGQGPGPYFMVQNYGGGKWKPVNTQSSHDPEAFKQIMERLYSSPAAREVDDPLAARGIKLNFEKDRPYKVSYNAWRNALEQLIPVENRLQLPKDAKVIMRMDTPDRLIPNQSRINLVTSAKPPKERVGKLSSGEPFKYAYSDTGEQAPVTWERMEDLFRPLERNYFTGFREPPQKRRY